MAATLADRLTGSLLQFGTGDGTTTAFQRTAQRFNATTETFAFYDWRGVALFYSTERKNLIKYSNDFTNALWSKQLGFAVDPTPVAGPSGANDAYVFNFSGTANNRIEGNLTMSSYTGSITFSIWLKGTAGETVRINIDDGAGGSAVETTLTLTASWVRYSVTTSLTAKTAARVMVIKRSGSTVTSCQAAYAQVEQTASPTPNITTTSAAVAVIDYTVSGNTVTFAAAPAAGVPLYRVKFDQYGKLI